MTARLRHIAISVPDPEAAAVFFEKAFGMTHAGYSINIQIACAALVGGIGAVLLGQWKKYVRLAQDKPEVSQHLDIGAVVLVEIWSEQKTAQVQHRGANWAAVLSPGQVALPGSYRIIDVKGNHLILEKFSPQ